MCRDEAGLAVKVVNFESWYLDFEKAIIELVALESQNNRAWKVQRKALFKKKFDESVNDALEWARQERDISIKAEKNRVINALIPYLKHSHRDRPINPNLYGGPTYSDATDCEACGMVGQLRRERKP